MNEVGEYFEPDGPLARQLEEFAPRAQQVLMAEAIEASIDRRESLIIEAGTGTGKTFAYLLPALTSSQRVIVSTGTRALQDQLYHRDLPTIGRAIGRPVKAALLKGRSNYLCLHRLDLARGASEAGRFARELRVLTSWRQATRAGDIHEIADIEERSPIWQRVTSTADNCVGADCEFYDACFVVKARRAAAAADLVVVNHHLLLADLAMKEAGFDQFLPGADAFIIDEAHQLPDIAGHFFGTRCSSRTLMLLLEELDLEAVTRNHTAMSCALEALRKALNALRENTGSDTGRIDYEHIAERLTQPLESIVDAVQGLVEHVNPLSEESPAMESLANRLFDRLTEFTKFLDVDAYRGLRWVEIGKHTVSLNVTPLDSSEKLSAMITARQAAWVFTSATLAVGEDFAHFSDRLGLVPERTVRLESPYNLRERARLYLPPELPAPSAGHYTDEVVRHARAVAELTSGGIFMLFTSYRALNQAADLVRSQSAWTDRPILVQGERPRDLLLSEFRRHGNAVLLATHTFWEGVDVKGSALTVVVIDKLPFTAPSDPLLRARVKYLEEQGENGFMMHQLPQAALALKQGAGRLLRDPADFGVVVLCDPRLVSKSYGKAFLDGLAPIPVTHEISAIREFFETIDK